jgi:chromosome segregation ATPase
MARPTAQRTRGKAVGKPKNNQDILESRVDKSRDENEPLSPIQPSETSKKPTRETVKSQIAHKDIQIASLESTVTKQNLDFLELQKSCAHNVSSVTIQNQDLLEENRALALANQFLNSLKRKSDSGLKEELARRQKRVRRLERDSEQKKTKYTDLLADLETRLAEKTSHIAHLEDTLTSRDNNILSHVHTIASLRSSLKDKQTALTTSRSMLYATQKRADRAQMALKELKNDYKKLQTWEPTESGQYTAAARELARNLSYAGCAAEKVEFAVRSCAQAFGITIRQRFMSRQTVGRAIDEGGKYGEIQLGREIVHAPGIYFSRFNLLL